MLTWSWAFQYRRHDLPLEPAVMVKFPPLPVTLVKNADQRTLSRDLDLEKLVVPKKVGNRAPGLPPIQAKSLSPRKGICGVVDKQSKTSLPCKDYSAKQRAAPNLAVVADKSADKLQDIEIRFVLVIAILFHLVWCIFSLQRGRLTNFWFLTEWTNTWFFVGWKLSFRNQNLK